MVVLILVMVILPTMLMMTVLVQIITLVIILALVLTLTFRVWGKFCFAQQLLEYERKGPRWVFQVIAVLQIGNPPQSSY